MEVKKQGSIQKRTFSGWSPRWMCLTSTSLFIYIQQGDSGPRNAIPLTTITVTAKDETQLRVRSATSKIYKLQTNSTSERDEWLRAIKAACAQCRESFDVRPGVLQVTIVGARGLQARCKGGSSNPYAVLTVGTAVVKTPPIKSSLAPTWNTTQSIHVDDVNDPCLSVFVQLWSDGVAREKGFLGQTRLPLLEALRSENDKISTDKTSNGQSFDNGFSNLTSVQILLAAEERDKEKAVGTRWFRLHRRMKEEVVSGEVCLKIVFAPVGQALPSLMSTRKPFQTLASVSEYDFDNVPIMKLELDGDELKGFANLLSASGPKRKQGGTVFAVQSIAERLNEEKVTSSSALKSVATNRLPAIMSLSALAPKISPPRLPPAFVAQLPTVSVKSAIVPALICHKLPLLYPTAATVSGSDLTRVLTERATSPSASSSSSGGNGMSFSPRRIEVSKIEAATCTVEVLRKRLLFLENHIFPPTELFPNEKSLASFVAKEITSIFKQLSAFDASLEADGTTSSSSSPSSSVGFGIIRCGVLSADGLPKTDVAGWCDPYVQLFIDDKLLASTDHKDRTATPQWNAFFDLPLVSVQADSKFKAVILDWNRVSKHEVIGQVEVPITAILSMQGSMGGEWRNIVLSETCQQKATSSPTAIPRICLDLSFATRSFDDKEAKELRIEDEIWTATYRQVFISLLHTLVLSPSMNGEAGAGCLCDGALALLDEYSERWGTGRLFGRLKYLQILVAMMKHRHVPLNYIERRVTGVKALLKAEDSMMTTEEISILKEIKRGLREQCEPMLQTYQNNRSAFASLISLATWAGIVSDEVLAYMLTACRRHFEVLKASSGNSSTNVETLYALTFAVGQNMEEDCEHVLPFVEEGAQAVLMLNHELLCDEAAHFFEVGPWRDLDCRGFFDALKKIRDLLANAGVDSSVPPRMVEAARPFLRAFANKLKSKLIESAIESLHVDDMHADAEIAEGAPVSSSVTIFFGLAHETMLLLSKLDIPSPEMSSWATETVIAGAQRYIHELLGETIQEMDTKANSSAAAAGVRRHSNRHSGGGGAGGVQGALQSGGSSMSTSSMVGQDILAIRLNNFHHAADCMAIIRDRLAVEFVPDGEELDEALVEVIDGTIRSIEEAVETISDYIWYYWGKRIFGEAVRDLFVNTSNGSTPGESPMEKWNHLFTTVREEMEALGEKMSPAVRSVVFLDGAKVLMVTIQSFMISRNSTQDSIDCVRWFLSNNGARLRFHQVFEVEDGDLASHFRLLEQIVDLLPKSVSELKQIYRRAMSRASQQFETVLEEEEEEEGRDDEEQLSATSILRLIARKYPHEEAAKYTSTMDAVEAHELFALESTEGVEKRLTCMLSSLKRGVLFVTSRHIGIKTSCSSSLRDCIGEPIRIPLQGINSIGRDEKPMDSSSSFFWGSIALETEVGERIRLYHLHDVPTAVVTICKRALSLPQPHKITERLPPRLFVLRVTVLSADLRLAAQEAVNVGIISSPDKLSAYVELQVGQHRGMTQRIKECVSPTFNQSVNLDVMDGNAPLLITVKAHSKWSEDMMLGHGLITHIARVETAGSAFRKETVELIDTNHKRVGTVEIMLRKAEARHISASAENSPGPSQQQQSQQSNAASNAPPPAASAKKSEPLEEVFENQRRYTMFDRFTARKLQTDGDPPPWSDSSYKSTPFRPFEDDGWRIDTSFTADEEGWQYASDWPAVGTAAQGWRNTERRALDMVRRRRWIRGELSASAAQFATFVATVKPTHAKQTKGTNDQKKPEQLQLPIDPNAIKSFVPPARPTAGGAAGAGAAGGGRGGAGAAAGGSPPVMTGYVMKTKDVGFHPFNTRRRFLVVKDGFLFFYSSHTSKTIKRKEVLSKLAVIALENKKNGYYGIQLIGTKPTVLWVAAEEHRAQWIRSFMQSGAKQQFASHH